jgi:hypothetical protein
MGHSARAGALMTVFGSVMLHTPSLSVAVTCDESTSQREIHAGNGKAGILVPVRIWRITTPSGWVKAATGERILPGSGIGIGSDEAHLVS